MDKNNSLKFSSSLIFATTFIFFLQFMVHSFQSAMTLDYSIWKYAVLLILFLALIGMKNEYQSVQNNIQASTSYSLKEVCSIILVITTITLITFFTTNYFETTTIFSASLNCLLGAFILPKRFEAAVYSGAIAGMIGSYLCTSALITFIVGLVTGFSFLFFRPSFHGVGGRGGAIPYMGTLSFIRFFLLREPHIVVPIEKYFLLPSIVGILGAAIFTYLLHTKGFLSNVTAAMLVSLFSEIILPEALYPVTTAIFAGTIIGMSSAKNVENLVHLLVISLLAVFLFIPSYHILDGIGGKLGMMSVIAYLAANGLKTVARLVAKEDLKPVADELQLKNE